MRRQRPTVVLVLAILHLVGGGIGLFSSCYTLSILGVAQLSSPPPTPQRGPAAAPSSSDLMRYYAEHAPGYWVYQIGSLAASLLLDLLLVAGGIGLLRMQPWGRTLSLIYAPASIFFHIATFIYQIVYMAPLTGKMYAQYPNLAPLGSIMEVVVIAGLFVSLLICIYPIVVLVLLLRPATAAAFRGELSAEEPEALPEEDPWREMPRSDRFRR